MPIAKQKLCLILRGLPGTGKSYLSKEYLAFIAKAFNGDEDQTVILSSDDYFIHDKVYHFDKDSLADAHKWNWDRFKAEVEKATPFIIVDNTNIKKFHYYQYLDYAQRNDYFVAIVTIPHNDTTDKELAERNIHGVDRDTIRRMRSSFEWNL